jgi:hypothetical protein
MAIDDLIEAVERFSLAEASQKTFKGLVRKITYYRSTYDIHKYRGDKENRFLNKGETQYALTVEIDGTGNRVWLRSRSQVHKYSSQFWDMNKTKSYHVGDSPEGRVGLSPEELTAFDHEHKTWSPLFNVGDHVEVSGEVSGEKNGVMFLKTGATIKRAAGSSAAAVLKTSKGTFIASELDYLVKKSSIKKVNVKGMIQFAKDGNFAIAQVFPDAFENALVGAVIKRRMSILSSEEADLEARARLLLHKLMAKRRISFLHKEVKIILERLKTYLKTGDLAEE